MPEGWDFQERAGALGSMYKKDEDWMLSALQNQKSLADNGHLHTASLKSLPSSALMQSGSMPSLRIKTAERNPIVGFLPNETPITHDWSSTSSRTFQRLPMFSTSKADGAATKFGVRDEATGVQAAIQPCQSRANLAHSSAPLTSPPHGASGKIKYLPAGEQFGVPEAFGVGRAEEIYGVNRSGDFRRRPIAADPGLATSGLAKTPSSRYSLSRTPSQLELDDLLRKRSRARGLGGKHAKVCDVVQTRWNVLYQSGSASSCTMKMTG